MPSRHRSRHRALQILFQWDSRRGSVEDAFAAFYDSLYSEESETQPQRDEFVDNLVRGVVSNIESIDKMITAHAEHWRIERMPAVDRNVLRLAICEMMLLGTPPPVAIDEALELVRRFSGEGSVQFANGVLDAARREIEAAAASSTGLPGG